MSTGQVYDRRRNNGPENSFPPVFFVEDQDAASARKRAKGKAPARDDGREHDALRPIFLQCGLIPQASGSAYIETGNLKIACAIYGPRQIRGRQYSGKAELHVDVRYAPFATEVRRRPGKDAESSTLSHAIAEALLPSLRLDLLPKASIDVFLTILQADAPEAGCIAAGVTVASTALAEAGIEMYGLTAGVSALIQAPDDEEEKNGKSTLLLVDPDYAEAHKKSAETVGTIQLSAMPALGSVTSMRQSLRTGVPFAVLDSAIDKLMQKTAEVHAIMANTLSESFAGSASAS